MKESQNRKVVKVSQKVKKRLSPKSRSELKKQKSPELKTSATNQNHSLPPELGKPLPNEGKRLFRPQY